MSTKQVKVDNWGIYFLQRLKHFFNRTDYCDLTLQFQDNAQLKVHRLVISACTEYFELLERTCEMYEDCLVMPDDLQADVVVPIVNFMYTGQLEFKQELLEKLYQTSLVMNMPVLSKLLSAHRQNMPNRPAPMHSYSKNSKQDVCKQKKMPVASSSGMGYKRSFGKAFEHDNGPKPKKSYTGLSPKQESIKNGQSSSDSYKFPIFSERNKQSAMEPRPTRYELPEELDEENVFDNSFTSISYASKPLMVHPETVKQYGSKKTQLFEDASSSKRFFRGTSNDIVECRKISMHTSLFDDGPDSIPDEEELYQQPPPNKEDPKDASQLFDQFIESEGPKLTIETKDSKQVNNIDHAKIISEVLKKYPHLMKSNKNIKLKILDTPSKPKKKVMPGSIKEEKEVKPKQEPPDFTYESDVIDSKEAARLIALGAENINGPWICLICGTPGRALHFTSYYKFRRHLVEVHNEKPVSTICEYCGLKSLKRNYLLHHLYTKHGIEPPSNYTFPKCNYCNYIALTEGFLVKHKMTHTEYKGFRCNVCASTFGTSNQLLLHIQKTGHKYSADRRTNLQCIYCLKVFLREANLYTHLKTNHKQAAKTDGIIDDSEDEKYDEESVPTVEVKQKQNNESNLIKCEMPRNLDNYESVQYHLEQKEDANIQIVSRRSKLNQSRTATAKHKILNTSLEAQNQVTQSASNSSPKKKTYQERNPEQTDFLQDIDDCSTSNEEILLIDNNEYIIHNNQLIPKKEISTNDEYSMASTVTGLMEDTMPVLAAETLLEFQNIQTGQPQSSRMIVKKNTNINQPIQIVVSNEEEYKALMASNHSIIFDDGDPNKTLTVLTAQTSMPLESNTIDLETSQSNEMMIIPDNYPISVSETVPADSSNIVVLYSHPIEDQNSQHITRQGIEAQFVQSSAIITQNFETVTTCTPVMSAHVVNTSVETWQANITENINKVPITSTQTSIATVTPIESITSANLNELPEIQLTTGTDLSIEMSQQSLVTTNEVGPTINVYSQSEEIENNRTVTLQHVSEEVGNDNILTSENQADIVNSFNLLEQNVVTTEIRPQTNIIIGNSSQIDLSALANDVTLRHTTGSAQNNENIITDDVDMRHTHIDDMVTTAPVHIEEIQTTESTVNNEPVTDRNNSILINNSQESRRIENQESETVENQESQTDTDQESRTVENQESLTVENQDSPIVENQESPTVENQESQTIEYQERQTIEYQESQTIEYQESQTVEYQESQTVEYQESQTVEYQGSQTAENEENNTPEELSIQNSVTVEVQHMAPNVNIGPENNEEKTKTTENNNLENENENDERIENTMEDIGVEPNTINQDIQTAKIPENSERVISNISEIPKPSLPTINYKASIENLTSEWSEDESDIQPEQNTHPNINAQEPETLPEIEESIENIQQEIDKHIATSAKQALNEREQRKSLGQDLIATQNKIVPNEKISSLLNDWDDNDSQEEDVSTEQPTVEKDISENENAVSEKCVNDNANINKDDVLKSDNIKSLVSDWDEEEEQELKD